MELARKAGLAGCEPGPSPALSPGLGLQEQATLPGFSTWLLVIKVRYTTEPFPQYLSVCLFFFSLEISNPFVYLKLTWWYRKSPDSLSPQWAWKFLYLTPCFTICWKRWNNTKAILLPRPVVYVGMDVLYIQYDIILTVWHHPRICLQCSKTLLCSTCCSHPRHLLSLYFTETVFINIQNTAFNWVHLWCIIFPVIMSQHV